MDQQQQEPGAGAGADAPAEQRFAFLCMFGKKEFEMDMGSGETVGQLKEKLGKLTEIPPAMQKLLWKGVLKDDTATLAAAGVKNKAKIMVVGSTMGAVLASTSSGGVAPPPDEKAEPDSKMSEETRHIKVISKGPPDDAHPAILGAQEALPEVPLTGMLDMHGKKIRLTFKQSEGQVWIGSAERTSKYFFSQITAVTFETIESPEHPGYEIMALQLGKSEQSKMYIYFVPGQYKVRVCASASKRFKSNPLYLLF